jgi:hypothetical protein
MILIRAQGKTNAAYYELFSIITEANGQGIPLAFIFTTSTDGTAEPKAKERALDDVMCWLKGCSVDPKFTLSDKDISEINVLHSTWPAAKHQSCYWHAMEYVEKRLGEDKPPGSYDAKKAHAHFAFIDPTWVPGVTRPDISNEDADDELVVEEQNEEVSFPFSTREKSKDLLLLQGCCSCKNIQARSILFDPSRRRSGASCTNLARSAESEEVRSEGFLPKGTPIDHT